MKPRRDIPTRTCIGCRCRDDRPNLARFVRGADGELIWDARGVLPGRGAYLHRALTCWDAAVKRRAFTRALREAVTITDPPEHFA